MISVLTPTPESWRAMKPALKRSVVARLGATDDSAAIDAGVRSLDQLARAARGTGELTAGDVAVVGAVHLLFGAAIGLGAFLWGRKIGKAHEGRRAARAAGTLENTADDMAREWRRSAVAAEELREELMRVDAERIEAQGRAAAERLALETATKDRDFYRERAHNEEARATKYVRYLDAHGVTDEELEEAARLRNMADRPTDPGVPPAWQDAFDDGFAAAAAGAARVFGADWSDDRRAAYGSGYNAGMRAAEGLSPL